MGYGRFFGLDRRVWLALPETLCRIRNWTVSIVRQMRIIIGKVGLGFFAFFAGLETRAPPTARTSFSASCEAVPLLQCASVAAYHPCDQAHFARMGHPAAENLTLPLGPAQ